MRKPTWKQMSAINEELHAILIFAEENDFDISQFTITQIVLKALTELHGQVGAAIPFEVTRCKVVSSLECAFSLILPGVEKKKVWSALTMLAEYGSVECSINVQCNQDKSDGLAAVLCK